MRRLMAGDRAGISLGILLGIGTSALSAPWDPAHAQALQNQPTEPPPFVPEPMPVIPAPRLEGPAPSTMMGDAAQTGSTTEIAPEAEEPPAPPTTTAEPLPTEDGEPVSSPAQPSQVPNPARDLGPGRSITRSLVERIIEPWSLTPRIVARQTIDRLGLPAEATSSLLLWHRTGPWKRVVVYHDGPTHLFPIRHADVLEHVVDLRVPADRADEVLAFDGSVVIDRTRGEVAARSDREELNTLTLNLVSEIAAGRRSPEEARRVYADSARRTIEGVVIPAARRLLFSQGIGATADPDRGDGEPADYPPAAPPPAAQPPMASPTAPLTAPSVAPAPAPSTGAAAP